MDSLLLNIVIHLSKISINCVLEGTVINVVRIVPHENYNSTTYNNDVAVLFLGTELQLGTNVQTVSIPLQGETLPINSRVVTVGWGRTVVSILHFF